MHRPRRGCASSRLQEAALAPTTNREDLREDRERGFLLRVGADVEAARAHDPRELVLRDAGLEQPLAAPLLIAPRPERPDVERLGLERADERGLVELVVVGQDDDRGLVVGRTCAIASCGHSTMSSSADGIRSRVANFARASATIACQPRSFARGTSPRPCPPRRRRRPAAAARTTRRTPSSRRRAR